MVSIFFEDLGRLKTQPLFLPLHKVSNLKSFNSDSLGSEEINDVGPRRWSSVMLAGEIELHHTLLEPLIDKSRRAEMQSMWGEKLMKVFYNHSSRL
jgi:hypothetical protein